MLEPRLLKRHLMRRMLQPDFLILMAMARFFAYLLQMIQTVWLQEATLEIGSSLSRATARS